MHRMSTKLYLNDIQWDCPLTTNHALQHKQQLNSQKCTENVFESTVDQAQKRSITLLSLGEPVSNRTSNP